MGGSAAAWSSDSDSFDQYTWQGTVGIAERLWVGSPHPAVFNLTAALPRLAVHACRMKQRGFELAAYKPSTDAMAGYSAWCTGGAGAKDTNGNTCQACPAEWDWPSDDGPPDGPA